MIDDRHDLPEWVLDERDRRVDEVAGAQRGRQRAKRSRQSIVAAGLLAAVAGILAGLPPAHAPEPARGSEPRSPARRSGAVEIVERTGRSSIEIISSLTSPGRRPGYLEDLDDARLVSELRGVGYDVGLATVGGKVLVIGGPWTDASPIAAVPSGRDRRRQ